MEEVSFKSKNPFKEETTKMLERIYQKLSEEKEGPSTEMSLLDRVSKYTGLQTSVLEKINDSSIQFDRVIDFSDRSILYNAYISYCIRKTLLPTTHDLFRSLENIVPPYMDLPTFRKILVQMGYTWKSLHENYNKWIVIEKPSIVLERMEYLKALSFARKSNKPVYYIIEFAVLENGKFLTVQESLELEKRVSVNQSRHLIAVSGEKIHIYKAVSDFSEETFEHTLLYDLNLFQSSVIILNNEPHHSQLIYEVPTVNSLKVEMKEWLLFRNIPFEENYSKTELFDLIEKSLKTEQGYKISEIMKSQHNILRLPPFMKDLSIGHLVFNLLKDNYQEVMKDVKDATIESMVNAVTAEHLSDFDKHVQGEEERIYSIDVEFEDRYDFYFEATQRLLKKNKIQDEDSDLPLSDFELL